ncbi:hypothetical protein [Halalkalicoccus jeotgali]|nr:hypothetical protein [Halalkalicoccus jeotgali]
MGFFLAQHNGLSFQAVPRVLSDPGAVPIDLLADLAGSVGAICLIVMGIAVLFEWGEFADIDVNDPDIDHKSAALLGTIGIVAFVLGFI